MKNLFSGPANRGAVLASAVLAGVEVLLQNSNKRSRRSTRVDSDLTPAAAERVLSPQVVVEASSPLVPKPLVPEKDAERNFSIKRTKSEVGYVYWILEGFGKYKCFILCDSWDEAVAQAKARLAETDTVNTPQAMAAQA